MAKILRAALVILALFGPMLVGLQAARTHSFRSGFAGLAIALAIGGVLPLCVGIRPGRIVQGET
jgi:MFS-type transporter involved in bile tolerance (Atg22 family)